MGDEKSKTDTRLLSLSGDGKVTMKLGALIFVMLGALTGTNYYTLQAAAPDPAVVETTARDVGEIKQVLARLTAQLAALADTRAQDRQEIQRQLDEQRRRIDELQDDAVSQRQLNDLERRLAELERKMK